MFLTIILCGVAYLLGSINCAILVCRWAGLADPRSSGSQNPGATNVLRVGNKKYAAVVLVGDVLKGVAPIILARGVSYLFPHGLPPNDLWLGLFALCAFLGHLYPVFFQFKGGKGVATLLGTLLALSPLIVLGVMIVWLLVAYSTKYASLASMVAALASCLLSVWLNISYFPALLMMTGFLLWRHKENIVRLKAGVENKIGG